MGFRFFKRIKLGPGMTLNLSKLGGSLSFGPKGSKFTIASRGAKGTFGIPGTGLFYTITSGTGQKRISKDVKRREPDGVEVTSPLTMSFFQRLITPKHERALIDGCKEVIAGNDIKALHFFEDAVHVADGAFIGGFISLRVDKMEQAIEFLKIADQKKDELGHYFKQYGFVPEINLPITDEVFAEVTPDLRGVLLGLTEAYQYLNQLDHAKNCLERLIELEPDDPVVKLSLAEVLFESHPYDKNTLEHIRDITSDIKNESPIHCQLLLYRAMSLRELGLLESAKEILSNCLRIKKGMPPGLLTAIKYERAVVYENMGKKKQARKEFERIYAKEPRYRDVSTKINMV